MTDVFATGYVETYEKDHKTNNDGVFDVYVTILDLIDVPMLNWWHIVWESELYISTF